MGEKKRRLAARGVQPLQFDRGAIVSAFRALATGDRGPAERAFEALQAAAPRDPEVLHAVGVLGLQLGHNARAAELIGSAIELDPGRPDYRCHLGIAWRRLGKQDQAIAQLETALQLDPALAEAHSNLGLLLLERMQHDAAARSFERALALRHDFPDALNGLALAELALGHYERARANLERALALDPGLHEARYNLSRAHAHWAASLRDTAHAAPSAADALPHAEDALEQILIALQLSRDNAAYWAQFEGCVSQLDLRHPVDPRVRQRLLEALEHPAVDPARLARPIISVVVSHPDAIALAHAMAGPDLVDASAWREVARRTATLLDDSLLVRLLEVTVVPSAFIQQLITVARRGLLGEWAESPGAEPALPLASIAALAHQGFSTEYVNDESAEESALVARLAVAITTARMAGTPVPLRAYALYACYRPLHALDAAETIATELLPTALRPLAVRQVLEPLEERRIRPTIEAVTVVADPVSAAVREQYEANPYPRWLRSARPSSPESLAGYLHRLFPVANLEGLAEGAVRILVAGCGTGRHPISTAQRFPDASILAIDLSRASLAYAIRKTRELGIANVVYRQADILALDPIAGRFDVIECAGVLHHLRDPLEGWRALLPVLRPGGVMRIALYSERARRHVLRARELVAAEEFAANPEGIRAFRAAVLARLEDPLLARLARSEDFYSLSGCRDLVFHVEEHRFTLPRIAAVLVDLGLAFIGFEWPDAGAVAAYRAQFPEDRPLSDLANWDRFEADRPDTFAGMYRFWVRKPA